MTTKPLVFQNQHLQWQQRVDKERGTELRVKDESDMYRTFTETLPKYLEKMDRKKQRHFRGAHPQRYQADVASITSKATTAVFSMRSKSTNGSNHLRIREALDRRSQGGSSRRSQLTTSQRLQAMSTRASGRLQAATQGMNGAQTPRRTGKVTLKDFIAENTTYEDVVDQINKKIALKRAIDRANDAISKSKRPSEMSSRAGDFDSQANEIINNANVFSKERLAELDGRSRAATDHSKLSLYSISQKVAKQGVDMNESEYKSSKKSQSIVQHSLGSRTELRSTAHSLVDTLQMQLERERQQKRKLMEHLTALEQVNK